MMKTGWFLINDGRVIAASPTVIEGQDGEWCEVPIEWVADIISGKASVGDFLWKNGEVIRRNDGFRWAEKDEEPMGWLTIRNGVVVPNRDGEGRPYVI